jgi:hypothetical protein
VQAAEQLWNEAEIALAEAQPTNGHRAACWLLAVLQTGARAALATLSSLTQEVSHAAAEPETVPSSLVREAQAALAQRVPAMWSAAQQPTLECLQAVCNHAEAVFSTAEAMLEAPLSAGSASGRIWQRVLAFLLQVGYGSCRCVIWRGFLNESERYYCHVAADMSCYCYQRGPLTCSPFCNGLLISPLSYKGPLPPSCPWPGSGWAV